MVQTSASWSAVFRGRRLAHTLLLILGVGLHAIDVFIVATILPSVVTDIGGAAFYTWTTMLYVVASILGQASGTLMKARYGLRRGYTLGVLGFLCGSLGCAVAPHMTVLLVARTVQGLGGGVLLALSYSMVGALYPEDLRPRVLAAISGVWGAAALLGPLLGGVFAELGWWRGAFWVSLPVVMVLLSLVRRTLSLDAPEARVAHVPLLRLLLLGAGVLGIASSGHVSSLGIRLVLVGAACLAVAQTFRLDARAVHPLFPSQPVSLTHPVGTAIWVFFLTGVIASQVSVFMPLVVHMLQGVSPLGAGYFVALRSVSWTAAALCSAGLKPGVVRVLLLLGPLVLAGGAVGQAAVIVEGPLLLLGGYAVLTGIGTGLCFAHFCNWTLAAARQGENDRTAASIPTAQSLGLAFGAASAGLVANAVGLSTGMSTAIVAAVARWVYGVSVVAPIVVVALAGRFLWLYRNRRMPS